MIAIVERWHALAHFLRWTYRAAKRATGMDRTGPLRENDGMSQENERTQSGKSFPTLSGFKAGAPVPGTFPAAGPGQKSDVVLLQPGAKPKDPPKTQPPEQIDTVREILETIVFVVVLVMILKTFLAEAFVIPTGSMATTLLGYQIQKTCPECGHSFPVNCSQEADPQDVDAFRRDDPLHRDDDMKRRFEGTRVEWSRCENCGLVIYLD
jgi:hypothetical protein